MELKPQLIKNGSKIEYAVLPYNEYLKIKDIIEDYDDLKTLRKAKKADNGKKGKSAKELLIELK